MKTIIISNLFFKTSILIFGYKNGVGYFDIQVLDMIFPFFDIHSYFNLDTWFNTSNNSLMHMQKYEEFCDKLVLKKRDVIELVPFYQYREIKEIVGIRKYIYINPIHIFILKIKFPIILCPFIMISLTLKELVINIFKLFKNRFNYSKVKSKSSIKSTNYTKIELPKNKKNYYLDNILSIIPNHLREFTVYMAPKFNPDSMNSIKSFQTLDNYNTQIRNHYNAVVHHYNNIVNILRTNNIRVVYNGNIFRLIVPSSLNISVENAILHNFQQSIDQIFANLLSLNTLMQDYNIASDYLVRDGYTGNLIGETSLIYQARSLYDNLIGSFIQVSQQTIQGYILRISLVNRLVISINRFREISNSTQNYLINNDIGFHQGRAGGVELSFPSNSPLNTEQATNYIQDMDLEINTLTENISNLISQLNDLETNRLGLEVSQMRVHELITAAADLQRS